VPEFHAEAPQATVSEGLAQGPYVEARAGVKPTTLRTIGVNLTIDVKKRLCTFFIIFKKNAFFNVFIF